MKWPLFGQKTTQEAPPSLSGGAQRAVYAVGAVFALALLAPIALAALTTVTSIATAIVVGVAIMGTLSALPALNYWWKIQVLKMLKATARRNPVETLQLELLNRQKGYEAASRQSTVITAKRDSLLEQLQAYEDKHQVADEALEKMVNKLSQFVDRLKASLKRAGVKLGEFERFVERQADRWEIAKSTGELAAMLRQAQGGDVTSAFLANTAIESIRNELNLSFAELEQILDRDEVKALVNQGDVSRLSEVTLPPLQIEAAGDTVAVRR